MMKTRLYVDMDGTIAEWRSIANPETLYQKGYFATLSPYRNVVNGIRMLNAAADVELYILSHYLPDSVYALSEKKWWISRYLDEIPESHRIFLPCGLDKAKYRISEDDFLLDDYSANLHQWGKTGIKVLNGVNATHGTWTGSRISRMRSAESFCRALTKVLGGGIIKDRKKQA